MRKSLLVLLMASVFAGCLSSSAPVEVSNWTIDVSGVASSPGPIPAEGVSHGAVRLSQVSVRAPYDARQIAVLRKNGSVAFDAYNQFASSPAALAKGAALDMLASSKAFRSAVASASAVRSELSAELSINRLALDCRVEGERKATVALALTIVRDREIFAAVTGEAAVDAADGDYSKAFSAAFAMAMEKALGGL